MERALYLLVILATVAGAAAEEQPGLWKGFSVSCLGSEDKGNASCHGIRLVRKIVQSLLEEARRRKSFVIVEGVSLVESDAQKNVSSRSDKDGALGTVINFLENRELRVQLGKLVPNNWEVAVQESLPVAGRGHKDKDKKGDNGVMMMAVMMGKMLAAIGFGTLALMAMKALILSSLALMLSLIVAFKKHHGGSHHHEDHHLVYAQEVSPHYRRRRSNLNLAENFENHPYRKHVAIEKLR